MYFLFGEANLGTKANRRAIVVASLVKQRANSILGQPLQLFPHIEREYHSAFLYAASLNGFTTTLGNTAELMPDALVARTRLIEDIDRAEFDVSVLYYIWLNDDTGVNVAHALMRAAQRGITCRVMADALGSREMIKSPLWRSMRDAGVKTSIALPFRNLLRVLLRSRFDLRNHRKITVIDNRVTYCGSQNCADPEFRVKSKYAPWIDILIRFEGPVVTQNKLLFASDWIMNNDESVDSMVEPKFEVSPSSTNQELPDQGFPALVWGNGPTVRRFATPQMFATLITQAQEKLTISTPYFVPGDIVLEALCATALRGVKTTMIFPAINDSWIVAAASRSYYHALIHSGVRIFEFKGGLLHAKTLTIDDKVTMVGSSNMDRRSFDLNFENNILLRDDKLTAEVYQRQLDYLSDATEVTMSDLEKWPLPRRIWNNVIATLGPVL